MSDRFDAVAFMRRRRVEIDREDKGLTWQERSEKTLRLLKNDALWHRLKTRGGTPRRRHNPKLAPHRANGRA